MKTSQSQRANISESKWRYHEVKTSSNQTETITTSSWRQHKVKLKTSQTPYHQGDVFKRIACTMLGHVYPSHNKPNSARNQPKHAKCLPWETRLSLTKYHALSLTKATLHKKVTTKQRKWLSSVNCQMLKCSPWETRLSPSSSNLCRDVEAWRKLLMFVYRLRGALCWRLIWWWWWRCWRRWWWQRWWWKWQ